MWRSVIPGPRAEHLEAQTGTEIEFYDFTGVAEGGNRHDGKVSASLLNSLRETATIREGARNADVILIATGPNDGVSNLEALQAGTCAGPDSPCVHALGQTWSENFDAILTEIDGLRAGEPTAVRLINAATMQSPPPPTDVVATGLWLEYELLTAAMCDAAGAHDAVCVDVRSLFTSADENTPESMQAVADALIVTGLPELDQDSPTRTSL